MRQGSTDVMSGPITALLASPGDEIACGVQSVGFDARFCDAHDVRSDSGGPAIQKRVVILSAVVKHAPQCLPFPLPEVALHYLG